MTCIPAILKAISWNNKGHGQKAEKSSLFISTIIWLIVLGEKKVNPMICFIRALLQTSQPYCCHFCSEVMGSRVILQFLAGNCHLICYLTITKVICFEKFIGDLNLAFRDKIKLLWLLKSWLNRMGKQVRNLALRDKIKLLWLWKTWFSRMGTQVRNLALRDKIELHWFRKSWINRKGI